MMGFRGSASADECDAFSRRARRILNWRPGEVPFLKRKFWKRERKAASVEARREPETAN